MHRALNDSFMVAGDLRSLCDGFFRNLAWIDDCRAVAADDIDPAARSLLAYEGHMTAVLSNYYGEPVALDVRQFRQDGDQYRRKIILTVAGGSRVVEVGIVRLNLSFVDTEVRRAILERQTPLGQILNAHDVLTRVEPRWFVRFGKDSPVGRMFRPPCEHDVFGRVAQIHCNHKPVMELLEVVTVS